MADNKIERVWEVGEDSREALLGRAANEFSEQFAAGNNPSIDHYAERFPEIADVIRQVFPVLREFPVLNGGQEPGELVERKRQQFPTTVQRLGDYELLREIGRGGMGVVYEAHQVSLDKRVALKILPFAGVLDRKRLQRFHNEAKAAAQLQHPNIVPVHAVGSERGTHFYAMQYIEGNNLSQVIRDLRQANANQAVNDPRDLMPTAEYLPDGDPSVTEHGDGVPGSGRSDTAKSSGLLPFKTTQASGSGVEYFRSLVRLGIQVADAIQHAHDNGVIHRDIKPSNLILDVQGNVWITDFGLAQMQGDASLTATGDVIGTLRYMSPEQVLSKRVVVDYRTDIYSLGATLYELLTLRPVCDGSLREEILRQIAFEEPVSPRKLDRRIPADLETIVLKSLAKNPAERYPSAQELADDLRRHQADEPIRARRPSVVQRVGKWARRHRGVVSTAAALVGVAFFAWVISYWQVLQAYAAEKLARTRSESLLTQSEGLRLAALSMLERPKNPGRALSLAIEGRRRYESAETNNALLDALDENHELKTLRDHSAGVGNVSFSPDGQFVVTSVLRSEYGKSTEPARIWEAATGKRHCLIQGATAITSAAFSPAGGRLLAASSPLGAERKEGDAAEVVGGLPCLYDATSGGRLVELKDAFLFEAQTTCFSPNGQLVVAPARGNKARIYDVVEGFVQRELVGHTDRIHFAAFSPSGKFVVTISRDKTVRIWETTTGKELHRLDQWKKQPPMTAVFSPDERFLGTGSAEGAHLWNVANKQLLNPVHWTGDLLRFGADGAKVFVATRHANEVHAFDTVTRERLFEMKELPETINSLEVSPSGQYVGIACGKTLELRSFDNGTRQAVLRGHEQPILSFRFAPSGQELISGAGDKTARIWSVRSGAQRARFDIQPGAHPENLIAFSPPKESERHGQRVAVLTKNADHTYVFDMAKRVRIADFPGRFSQDAYVGDNVITVQPKRATVWDCVKRRERAVFNVVTGEIGQAQLGLDGHTALIVVDDGPVWVWNLSNGNQRELKGHSDRVWDAVLSRDGDYVATACKDGSVRLWRRTTSELIKKLQISGAALMVQFSPKGDRLMAVSDQNTASVWNVPSGEPVFELADPALKFNRARFSPLGDFLITYHGYDNDAIACWQGMDGKFLRKFEEPRGTLSITFSKKQPVLVAASWQFGLFRWNFETGESRRLTTTSTACSTFAQNEQHVVSATYVSTLEPEYSPGASLTNTAAPMLQIWDAESGQQLESITTPLGAVSRLENMPNGELLISALGYGAAILDVDSRKKLTEIAGHAAPISTIAFSPKGSLIATSSWDQTAVLWDASTGKLIRWLRGHKAPITALVFNPESDELATGAADGEIALWNVSTGERIRNLRGHKDLIYQLLYAPQGNRLLSSSRDGTLRLWNQQGETIHSITSLQGVFLEVQFSRKGALLAVPGDEQVPVQDRLDAQFPQPFSVKQRAREGAPQQFAVYFYRSIEAKPILLEHDAAPKAAAFSTDGDRVVTIDSAGATHVWDVEKTPQRLTTLPTSDSRIAFACFSPDSKRVLIKHFNFLSLWDVETGKQLGIYPQSTGISEFSSRVTPRINPFTPDGKWLISIEHGTEKHLRRWPTDILSYAEPFASAELTRSEKAAYHIPD